MADRSASLAFILSLTDKVTAPLGKVKMGFSDLAEQSEKHIKSIGLGLGGLTAAVVGIQQSMAPALEVNRALGDVRSLGVAEDALTALNSKSLAFAVNYGENAREFVASAYQIDGAIKGLVGNQLATFTNASSLVAKATKTDAATMGEYVGTLYNLQKSQADAMGKGAWVEKLGGQTALAVQLFRTSGTAMKDAFKEAGAIATTAGVDLAEQMAVIGTLSSTMEGGDAGGRYKAFFENIGAASEKLGMKFTDQQGKILPIMSILDKLQGKFGDLTSASAGAKLMEAFGGEGAQVIGALAKDTGRLRDGLDQLGKVRGLEKAEQMAQAMVDPWQQWASLVEVMRVVFGQVLIPVLSPFMNKMVEIGKTLVRWSQLFPNITRVIGITALTIMTIIGAMSLLTLTVGIAKLTWLGLLTVWKILNMTGLRSVAIFLYHTVMVIAFVAGLALMYTWMGLVRTGMLLWQGAVWLVNAALLANPIVWIVIGVIALVAAVAAAISFWDEWTTALLNSEAFKWVSAQLQALSDWFNSMGGWSGMAKAAWDGIVSIFHKAVNGLIELLNSIPGVNIEARFGGMPEVPGIDAATNIADKATAGQKVQQSINAADTATAAQKAQQTINAAIPSISPTRPTAVPPGGLLTSIQNNSNSQNKGVHVENMTIQNSKPMNPLEMENMMAMAVGG
ncbi:phage tail tape measure protein, TP901 family, core region [Pseudomonas frederiksbergensis]|uniref:Phage tail tape measure protein, TP901 family, core region n=1 Tax=Pseudomonas frederiksbergensis TaxID=104087 RepID=A0A1H4YHK6_9PSED|nr:phage tail tape measure protein [Pseudomonas frederiksbergensis]SED16548.1 phage tail tape measure protein, TP901 family, core region [Pseudomonas frederiksbergensis]